MSSAHEKAISELLAQMSWARSLARDLVRDLDRADDLVQELWIKALKDPPSRPGSVKGWISRVMRNRVYEQHRNASRRAELAAPPAEPEAATPAETLERLETVELLGQLVRGLPQPFQSAILLRYFENCSLEEVARRSGITRAAAETRVRRGRELIEAQLRARDDAELRLRGVLLLAAPMLKSSSPLLTVGAALMLLGFLLVPFAWRLPWRAENAGEPAPGGAPTVARALLLAPPESDAPGATGGVERRAASVAQSIEIQVFDAVNQAAVADLDVHVTFRDARGKPLAERQWRSVVDRPFSTVLPAESAQITWSVRSEAGITDGGGTRAHQLTQDSQLRPIRIPVWRLEESLHGVVLDASGFAVPHAEVAVWYGDDESAGAAPARTVRVERDGSFRISAAAARGVRTFLAPTAEGYSASSCFKILERDWSDEALEPVVLTLEAGGQHRVRVENADGQPLAAASVTLWWHASEPDPHAAPGGTGTGRRTFRLLTDELGASVSVPVGRSGWQFQVDCPAYLPWSGEVDEASEETRVVLHPAPRLRGWVRGADQLPAGGVRVIAESSRGSSEAVSDGAGSFELALPGFPHEAVRLVFLPQDPALSMLVTPPFHAPKNGILPAWELRPGRTLSAEFLTLDGEPWTSEEPIDLRAHGGRSALLPDAVREESWLDTRERYEPTGAWRARSGARLLLSGLPEDPVQLTVMSARGVLAEALLWPGAPHARIRMASYPEPRAALLLRPQRSGAAGSGADRYRVRAQRNGAGNAEVLELDALCVDGGVELLGLLPGSWDLQVFDHRGSSLWSVQGLALEAGARLSLTPLLEESFAGVLRIVRGDHAPAASALVELLRYDGSLQPIAPGELRATTDADGRIALARLPRSLELRLAVTTQDGVRRVLPAGSLDPSLTRWQLTLPD